MNNLRLKVGDRVVYCKRDMRGTILRRMGRPPRKCLSGDWIVKWDNYDDPMPAFDGNMMLESEFDGIREGVKSRHSQATDGASG